LKRRTAAVIGFLYGLGLAVIGVLLTAAGHGTYILLGITSAPVSFLGMVFSIVAPPIFWAVVWILLAYKVRIITLCILIVHYASIPFVVFFRSTWRKSISIKYGKRTQRSLYSGYFSTFSVKVWFGFISGLGNRIH